MNLAFPFLAALFIRDVWYTLGTVLVLILVDVALGILAAVVTATFDVRKLPSFLRQNVLPYLGALTLLALVAAQPELKILFFASAAAVVAKFLADIKDKVTKLVGYNGATPSDDTGEKYIVGGVIGVPMSGPNGAGKPPSKT